MCSEAVNRPWIATVSPYLRYHCAGSTNEYCRRGAFLHWSHEALCFSVAPSADPVFWSGTALDRKLETCMTSPPLLEGRIKLCWKLHFKGDRPKFCLRSSVQDSVLQGILTYLPRFRDKVEKKIVFSRDAFTAKSNASVDLDTQVFSKTKAQKKPDSM